MARKRLCVAGGAVMSSRPSSSISTAGFPQFQDEAGLAGVGRTEGTSLARSSLDASPAFPTTAGAQIFYFSQTWGSTCIPSAQPLCYQNHWVLQNLSLSSFLAPSVPAFLQGQPKPLPQLLLLMLQDFLPLSIIFLHWPFLHSQQTHPFLPHLGN